MVNTYCTKQTYLDCRSNRFAGKCKISLANSPLHCWNFQLNHKAVANAQLYKFTTNDVHKVVLKAKCAIPRNTEILCNYGKFYNTL